LLAGQGADGRARMAKKADAMLATMTDNYLRQAWQQEVEQATGITLKQARRSAPAAPVPQHALQLNPIESRFLAALLQQPQRFAQLPDLAHEFFIDNQSAHLLYSRAFSTIADAEDDNTDIARQLAQEFPDCQQMISRWVNQATVQDTEFTSLLLDMEANDIRRRMRRGLSLSDAIPMQTRLREIQGEQKRLTEQLHETGE